MGMYLTVGELCIELWSESDILNRQLEEMFGTWLTAEPTKPVAMRLETQYVNKTPERPDIEPIFVDSRNFNPDTGTGLHDVYRPSDDIMIHYFPDGAYLHVPLRSAADEIPVIKGCVTPSFVNYKWLDDYITVAIAPILRQRQHYFIHSSGVSLNGQGVLFSGQSHSGKTTTCINLILNGWRLLANDIVILHPKEDGVYAYPIPDLLSLRPRTFALLPALNDALEGKPYHEFYNQKMLSSAVLFSDKWSEPVRVKAICFPRVCNQDENVIEPQIKALALAQLLETSMDCWDDGSLETHTSLMTQLSSQADCYILNLGRDVEGLPDMLQSQLL